MRPYVPSRYIKKIIFLFFYLCCGIPNFIIRKHLGQSVQIKFVRMLNEVFIRKRFRVFYSKQRQKWDECICRFAHQLIKLALFVFLKFAPNIIYSKKCASKMCNSCWMVLICILNGLLFPYNGKNFSGNSSFFSSCYTDYSSVFQKKDTFGGVWCHFYNVCDVNDWRSITLYKFRRQ